MDFIFCLLIPFNVIVFGIKCSYSPLQSFCMLILVYHTDFRICFCLIFYYFIINFFIHCFCMSVQPICHSYTIYNTTQNYTIPFCYVHHKTTTQIIQLLYNISIIKHLYTIIVGRIKLVTLANYANIAFLLWWSLDNTIIIYYHAPAINIKAKTRTCECTINNKIQCT